MNKAEQWYKTTFPEDYKLFKDLREMPIVTLNSCFKLMEMYANEHRD